MPHLEQLNKEEILAGKLLLVDKPLTWTSFSVVNKLRYSLKKKLDLKKIKVGHAGTLDPLATGLLIICVGKFTKKIDEFMGLDKEYTGTITLGYSTESYDLEMPLINPCPIDHINDELLEEARKSFLGDIEQTPPIFSAIKKDGQKSYEAARQGVDLKLSPRTVSIKEFEIDSTDFPILHFRVVCSKGTYIRSLANDFGQAVNSSAHLSSLRRTKIGNYSVDNTLGPEEWAEKWAKASLS